MGKDSVFQPSDDFAKKSHVQSMEKYKEIYKKSIEKPEEFWCDIAKEFHWEVEPNWEQFLTFNFDIPNGPVFIKCLEDGKTNISYNVLERNINKGLGDKIAFYWEGNDPADVSKVTYSELLKEVCKFSNVLKSHDVGKGDKVALYMPMIVEAVVAMLACARIGAMHSVVFAGFSSDSLAERILDAECKVLVTADGVWRGEKMLHLKEICDQALETCESKGHNIAACIVVRHLSTLKASATTNGTDVQHAKRREFDHMVAWAEDRDYWWHEQMNQASDECPPEWMNSEDPLFLLYTSGSTGKPKGIVHSIAGYMIYAATTFKYTFDYHEEDVFWCTADVGWITGHSYVVYGPMANGATSVLFEGTPFYPKTDRFWAVVDKYLVSKFYTAPTAIRALMKFGEEPVKKHSRSSLRVLGTVGEPINPEAWLWYYRVVGDERCPIVDTFWQTETGGHVLTPLPGCTPAKPGAACFPFFGVVPAILDETGTEIDGVGEGYLVFKKPWPGIMRTVFKDHTRFEITYFTKFPGYYCTGDGAKRDSDGYLWVTGRVDDMLNVSGHLLSTAQVESALIEHKGVAEAAVVPFPHPIKGECLYCFVTTKDGIEYSPDLEKGLRLKVRERIGPFAVPEYIQHAPQLPKTRSGKIMRRILRQISRNQRDLGDVSTLADESVVEILFQKRPRGIVTA